MAPLHLRAPLRIAQIVAFATLVRSVAFDRWITVLVSALLLGGVWAASRGRTWGVGLMLAMAAAFPMMFLLGMAPGWFCLVGVAGALPFIASLPAFTKFDKQATALLAALAGGIGTGIAYGWHAWAPQLIAWMPSLRPGYVPHHGLLIAVLGVLGLVLAQRRNRDGVEASGTYRIATEDERVRVAALDEADAAMHGEDEWETPARRQARR